MENVELLENEYFIPLKGFERTYQISNLGRVYNNYTKNLHKSIENGDRYIIQLYSKQKKFHIYDLYKENFTKEQFNWYTTTINKCKIDNLQKEINGILYFEEWRPIKGYEDYYEVSNFGRVKSCIRNTRTWKIRKESIMSPHISIYIQIKLSKEGVWSMPLLHRLVAEAFVPNPNPEYFKVVHHKDFDKLNPFFTNLEWCSHSTNIKYTTRAGRSKSSQNGRSKSKINFEIAEEIRKFAKENDFLSQKQIGEKFGISREIAKDIINYKSWKNK